MHTLFIFLSCLILATLAGCAAAGKAGGGSSGVLFLGDSMAAGLSVDPASRTVNTVYAWGDEFKNAEVRGLSGATLDVVLTELPLNRLRPSLFSPGTTASGTWNCPKTASPASIPKS